MTDQKCKGTRDLLPDEMRKFRHIEDVFRYCCLRWDYNEVKTPTLEYLHLFTSTGTLTPSRLHKVYSFLDWDGWSGERVVLRPDGTIPIARLYIDNAAEKELAKYFYVTNVFSFEETGKETREKWQLGAELIGTDSSLTDVELVVLAMDVLTKLGFDCLELKLSHAGLIRAFLSRFGLDSEEQARIFDEILDGNIDTLTKQHPDNPEMAEALTSLVKLKGKSSGFLRNLKALFKHDLPELEPALGNFIDITSKLESLGFNYQIDIASGRGFEYYTGLIFQISSNDKHVGGGGRYDALVPLMGGKNTPASGFALYMDDLMATFPADTGTKAPASVLIRPVGESKEALKAAFSAANCLHDEGFTRATIDLGGEKAENFGFVLDIQDGSPVYVLTGKSRRRKIKSNVIDMVLEELAQLKAKS